MIFLLGETEPTIFVLLTEQDTNDMRGGRTKFADLGGRDFNRVVISLHKNQHEIEEMLKKAGHGALLKGMSSPIPAVGEAKCAGCDAIVDAGQLLDDKCIVCWRELAKS